MPRSIQIAVRFVVIVALITSLPMLVSRPSGAGTPYSSALSVLGSASALAATGCNHLACSNSGHGLKFTCAGSANTNCKVIRGGVDCSITTCA